MSKPNIKIGTYTGTGCCAEHQPRLRPGLGPHHQRHRRHQRVRVVQRHGRGFRDQHRHHRRPGARHDQPGHDLRWRQHARCPASRSAPTFRPTPRCTATSRRATPKRCPEGGGSPPRLLLPPQSLTGGFHHDPHPHHQSRRTEHDPRFATQSQSADIPIDGDFHEIHDDLLPVLNDSSVEFEIENADATSGTAAAGGAAGLGGSAAPPPARP
jgi:hypothetical protein